jgi:RimJ/RimL family protein N-acetyltransferase
VGYLVDPDWQGSGLGRILQQLLIDKARAMGFRGLSAQILADNRRMIGLAKSCGLEVEMERDGETCDLVMRF